MTSRKALARLTLALRVLLKASGPVVFVCLTAGADAQAASVVSTVSTFAPAAVSQHSYEPAPGADLLKVASALPPPKLEVQVVGAPETIFDWSRDQCEPTDTPDAPPRAYRDARGTVHFLSSGQTYREYLGADLDKIKYDCRPILKSAHNDDFSRFEDLEWVAAVYTLDGNSVYALIHDEYHGDRRPEICPSRVYFRCWSNVLTLAVSHDMGKSYQQPEPPNNLVAMPPYRYVGEVGHPVGYFQPSNIVRLGAYYYALFKTPPYLLQKGGVCLMRTARLDDPHSWRAWNGEDFSVSFVDPYLAKVDDPAKHTCMPLRARLLTMGGMARDEVSGAFVLVMQGGIPESPGHFASGIWATSSYNLIDWSDPVLVWSEPSAAANAGPTKDDDPSLLDPGSRSPNFETFGNRPYIYYVHHNLANQPFDRQLMRVKVSIKVAK